MIPKEIQNHIFYLKHGYTKELAKVIKEEREKFKKRKNKSN